LGKHRRQINWFNRLCPALGEKQRRQAAAKFVDEARLELIEP
jgi:hypothetical protein